MSSRIFLVDDHKLVREGLKRLLEDAADIEVCAEAGGGAEALSKARRARADVILLDISMPDMSGIEVLKKLKELLPSTPVIILSMHAEEQFAVRAYRAGASGYVTKSGDVQELLAAIRCVATGRIYVRPGLGEFLAEALRGGAGMPRHHDLSDRELQVLKLIGEGKTPGEAAAVLRLSPKTVSTYVARIRAKLKLNNAIEIAQYAVSERLVE